MIAPIWRLVLVFVRESRRLSQKSLTTKTWSHGFEPTPTLSQVANNRKIAQDTKMPRTEKGTPLGKIIETWPVLPDSIKESILLIINQFTQHH
jgi:hypothetical protein